MNNFDTYAADAQLLTETIADTKDISAQQNPSDLAGLPKIDGLLKIHWNVPAEMIRQGESTSLPTGTYTIPISIPDNAIISGAIIADHEVAKAGSGTITPAIGAQALTAVSTKQVVSEVSNVAVGTKYAAETAVTVVVASNTVTAGAFTLYIPYYLGQ